MLEGDNRGRRHCTRSVAADGGDGFVLNVAAEPAISGAGYRHISPISRRLPKVIPYLSAYGGEDGCDKRSLIGL